jgi:hypothetical protein
VDCTLSCLAVLPSQEGEDVSNSSDNLDTSGERGRAGYTKGPWEFDATNYGVCSRHGYGLLDSKGEPLCVTVHTTDVMRQEVEEATANARLIAAAPELLEACGLALQTLQSQGIYGPARNACEAAIKKATGE